MTYAQMEEVAAIANDVHALGIVAIETYTAPEMGCEYTPAFRLNTIADVTTVALIAGSLFGFNIHMPTRTIETIDGGIVLF